MSFNPRHDNPPPLPLLPAKGEEEGGTEIDSPKFRDVDRDGELPNKGIKRRERREERRIKRMIPGVDEKEKDQLKGGRMEE